MSSTYGWRKLGGYRMPIVPPYTCYAHPIPPAKVYHDRSSKCLGCPYPRHGLMCHSNDDGSCLRTDMQELEARQLDAKNKR